MSEPEVVIASLGCLTPREAEAVLWVANGKTAWEAGRILGVAESTLNAHIAHAAEKLGAVNRAHLVTRAFVRGILVVNVARALSLLLAIACAAGMHDDARRPVRPGRLRRREEMAYVVAAAGSTPV